MVIDLILQQFEIQMMFSHSNSIKHTGLHPIHCDRKCFVLQYDKGDFIYVPSLSTLVSIKLQIATQITKASPESPFVVVVVGQAGGSTPSAYATLTN